MEDSISPLQNSTGFPLECLSPLRVDHQQYYRRYVENLPRLFIKEEDEAIIHTMRISQESERMMSLQSLHFNAEKLQSQLVE